MNQVASQTQGQTKASLLQGSGILQRKCDCGNHTIAGGMCEDCGKQKKVLQRKTNNQSASGAGLSLMQAKLTIGASNDPLEQEADRIADQMLAAPEHSIVSATPVRIQRFAGQPTGQADVAPASVDQTLGGSGRPLEPALRQDMEQRFGYDFSRVRVHSDANAEQSARDVSAHAYTVGHNIVFGAGRFAPGTHEGRRLLAHELTHVVQQGGLGRAVQQASRISRPDNAAEVQAEQTATPVMASQGPVAIAPLSLPIIQRQPGPTKPAEPALTRAEEIQLSLTSPGQITFGLNPPMISLYNFVIDQPTLKAEHLAALKALGSVIKRVAGAKLYIAANGHADSSGYADRNIPLSRHRAIAVQNLLQQISGVPVDPSWFGESQPETTNDTVEGRSRNRRVDIYFRAPGGIHHKPDDKPEDKKPPHNGGNGDGGGDGWDWPSLCGSLLGALICGVVACAVAFEFCLFCLANPEVCLGGLRPKVKPKVKPKDEPAEAITSETEATSPGARTRTNIGVGEEVKLTHSPGSAAWTATGGTLSAANGVTVWLTAPDTARRVTVTAGTATIVFDVIAPNDVHMDRFPGTGIWHTVNQPDSGIAALPFLLPDTVNFLNVIYHELDVAGVPTIPGAYSCNTFSKGHCGAGGGGAPCPDSLLTSTVVAGKGTQAVLPPDIAYSGYCGGMQPPFVPGSITVTIPYEYKVGAGAFRWFRNVAQVHALAADASKLTTDKAGAHGDTTVAAVSSKI